MKKELRDQIKQDEFASGLDQAFQWARARSNELRIGAGVALVLAAAVGAFAHFRAEREREADGALREALATFEAPLASARPAGAEPPSGPRFASAEERAKTAVAAFDGIDRRYGSSAIAVRAKYYAALARIELKQYPEAEKALKELQARGSGLEPELARFALASLYRRSGQIDKAVEAYRGLATNPSAIVPRDFALMSAAETLDDARRFVEARAAYGQLLEEFPASVFAVEARTRAEYLKSAVEG